MSMAHPGPRSDPSAPYPAALARSWSLLHGLWLQIRPIRPDDIELEAQFVGELSAESHYNRFFDSQVRISREWLEQQTRIDYDRHMALVAIVILEGREGLIGVARYVRADAREVAEFAIVVADARQGRGIGTLLLGRLIECARGAGVARLVGDVFSTNNVMLRLAKRLGFTLERAIGAQGVRLAVLRLSDPVTMPVATQRGTTAAS